MNSSSSASGGLAIVPMWQMPLGSSLFENSVQIRPNPKWKHRPKHQIRDKKLQLLWSTTYFAILQSEIDCEGISNGCGGPKTLTKKPNKITGIRITHLPHTNFGTSPLLSSAKARNARKNHYFVACFVEMVL